MLGIPVDGSVMSQEKRLICVRPLPLMLCRFVDESVVSRGRGSALVRQILLTIEEIFGCRTPVLIDVNFTPRGLWAALVQGILSCAGGQLVS